MDIIKPFMVGDGLCRGSLIGVDDTVAEIWRRQNCPEALKPLLHQTVLIATALSAGIKYQGVFSLQIKGDGAVSSVFADVTTDHRIRAYLQVDPSVTDWSVYRTVPELFGRGQMIFSVATPGQEPYQGIVELTRDTLAETVLDYFRLSEQINTDLILRFRGDSGRCLLLQQLPDRPNLSAEEQADLWETLKVLMNSVRDDELFSPTLTADEILFRLFHANGLSVFEASKPSFSCSCYRGKMETFLKRMDPTARQELYDEAGTIETVCRFCGEKYVFSRADLGDEKSTDKA